MNLADCQEAAMREMEPLAARMIPGARKGDLLFGADESFDRIYAAQGQLGEDSLIPEALYSEQEDLLS